MLTPEVRLRVELGISAQQMVSQIMISNRELEQQIAKGIEQAIADLTEGDRFSEFVREGVREAMKQKITDAVNATDIRFKVYQAIQEKIGEKLKEYAERIADAALGVLPTIESPGGN